MQPLVIDTRAVPPLQRHGLIFSSFDALAVDEAIELVHNHDPVTLFFQFREQRAGLFEWAYREEGPKVWRVTVRRIAGHASQPEPQARGNGQTLRTSNVQHEALQHNA